MLFVSEDAGAISSAKEAFEKFDVAFFSSGSYTEAKKYLSDNYENIALYIFDIAEIDNRYAFRSCEDIFDYNRIPGIYFNERDDGRVNVYVFGTKICFKGSIGEVAFWEKIFALIIFGENPDYDNSRVIIYPALYVNDEAAIDARWETLIRGNCSVFNIKQLVAFQKNRVIAKSRPHERIRYLQSWSSF